MEKRSIDGVKNMKFATVRVAERVFPRLLRHRCGQDKATRLHSHQDKIFDVRQSISGEKYQNALFYDNLVQDILRGHFTNDISTFRFLVFFPFKPTIHKIIYVKNSVIRY